MKGMLSRLSYCAALLLFLAAPQARAQELRARELKPAFDFKLVQMPVEILSIKLQGGEVRPGEKVVGDDDWLMGLSYKLKNISDKPISYLSVGLKFPRPNGFVVYSLRYGVDTSRGDRRAEHSPPAIQPGQTFELTLTRPSYAEFQHILKVGEAAKSFDTAEYFVDRICFEGEPDIIWEGGKLKRRDPVQPTEFRAYERYSLPATQR